MRKNLLINFLHRDLPDGVHELLGLLGLWSQWDPVLREHLIYQKIIDPPRYPWVTRQFKGGTQEDWSKFLGTIVSTGWQDLGV